MEQQILVTTENLVRMRHKINKARLRHCWQQYHATWHLSISPCLRFRVLCNVYDKEIKISMVNKDTPG